MLMKTENGIQAYPLSLATDGEWVRIVSVSGGKNLTKRLTVMGMLDGTCIQMLQHKTNSGVVILCGETRLALGHGMAHKIIVEPAQLKG